jgi:hypothetical protein
MLGSCGEPKDRLTGVHSMTCAQSRAAGTRLRVPSGVHFHGHEAHVGVATRLDPGRCGRLGRPRVLPSSLARRPDFASAT